MFLYLKNILQLILSPSRGWEDVSVTTDDTYLLIHRFLFPLFCVTGLSVLMQMLYHSELTFVWTMVKAVVVFVSFFVGYFFALTMFNSFFYHFCEGEPNEDKCTIVIGYTLALLSIAELACNIMPVNIGLRYLLPLAVILIMWKSDIYLRVRSDKNFYFIIFAIITTIAPPLLIQTLFDIII